MQVDIDEILEQAETREMDENKGVGDELLSQFKIVTFDNLEDEEIENPGKCTVNFYKITVIYLNYCGFLQHL